MKKTVLKNWVVKVLGSILSGYIFFIGTTIDSLGNSFYNKILVIWTLLAIGSFVLLNKYSNIFED